VTIPDPAQLEAERERITKHLGLAALLPTRKVSQLLAQIGKISVATVRSREPKPAPAAPRPARVDIPAAALPPGIPVKASTALDLLTAARHAEQTGQIQEAERLLRRLVESYPEDDAGRIALTRLVIQRGAYSEAVEILQPIFRAPPKNWEPWFWMGTAQLGLGQHALADTYLSQALAREGKLPQLWVQRAVAAQQQGDNTRALQLLREAERLDPALPEIQLNIAYSSDAMGNIDAAIQAYRSFLAMTEGKAPYVNQRREVLQRLSRLGY
jgi:tetratricopeptide (TPR) repeat protein